MAALLLGEGDGEASAAAAPAVRVGAVVAGRVRRVEAFGVFVDLDCGNSPHPSFLQPLRAGLAHVSELADEFVPDPGARFRPGQRVAARVLKVDAATGRVSLSLRPSAVKGEPRPEVGGRTDEDGEDEEEEEESDIDDHVGDEEEEEEEGAAAEMEVDGGSDTGASEDASDGDARDDEGGSDDSGSPSAGLDSDDNDDDDESDEGLDALRRSAGGISRDNSAEFSEEEEEEEEDDSDDDEDASDSDDDLDESDDEEEEDSDVDARLGAAAAGGGRAARSPAPSHRVSAVPSSSSGLGGLDVGLPVGWGAEEEDDDGDDDGGGDDDGDKEGKPSTPAPRTPAAAASESTPATAASLSKAAKRRAERALVIVSWVVKVLDEMMNKVWAGSICAKVSERSAPSTLETKWVRMPALPKVLRARAAMAGPRSEPPMPMFTTSENMAPDEPTIVPSRTPAAKSNILRRAANTSGITFWPSTK